MNHRGGSTNVVGLRLIQLSMHRRGIFGKDDKFSNIDAIIIIINIIIDYYYYYYIVFI